MGHRQCGASRAQWQTVALMDTKRSTRITHSHSPTPTAHIEDSERSNSTFAHCTPSTSPLDHVVHIPHTDHWWSLWRVDNC